jgi:hypothetical protein
MYNEAFEASSDISSLKLMNWMAMSSLQWQRQCVKVSVD